MNSPTNKTISGAKVKGLPQSHGLDLKGNFILQENKVESKVYLASTSALVGSTRTVFYLLLPQNFSGEIGNSVGVFLPKPWENAKAIEAKVFSLALAPLRQPTAVHHSLKTWEHLALPAGTQHELFYLPGNPAEIALDAYVRAELIKGQRYG